MTVEDRFRREARATFARMVGYVQNLAEAYAAPETEGTYQLLTDVEVLTDLAIAATLGPPLTDEEITYLDVDDDDPEPDLDLVPTLFRNQLAVSLAHEIIDVVVEYDREHPDATGWADDPEVHACQVACKLQQDREAEHGEPHGRQADWQLCWLYLSNHPDGWMLVAKSVLPPHDEDEDEEDT